ncbi:MAG: type II toxin-antitoxin system Phd/YefM family antitoxin [Anaerolineae bacterium]|nr:type II toxin-antitoxin system Phd/YefM family antitoxin [Anaerolineae bacterium]
MTKKPTRIPLRPNTNLLTILEAVHTDGKPRVIEREGEPLAVIVNLEDYIRMVAEPKSKRAKKKLLSLVGVWQDLDAEQMIANLYKARYRLYQSD